MQAQAPIDRSQLPKATGKTEESPAVETWTLSNGMDVWLLRSDATPLISLSVILPQGTGTDPHDRAGLASFVVDMMDEGLAVGMPSNSPMPSSCLLRISVGEHLSMASTSISTCLRRILTPVWRFFADVIRRPTLAKADFDRRKEQRMASALAAEANPSAIAGLVRRRALYCGGYAGLSSFGVRQTIDAITLADLKARYAELVQPTGGTIVVVGAVDKDTLNTSLETHFGDWTGSSTLKPNAHRCDALNTGALHLVDFPGAEQSMVIFARRAPGTDDPEYFSAQVFNRPFAGSFTGRVNMNCARIRAIPTALAVGLAAVGTRVPTSSMPRSNETPLGQVSMKLLRNSPLFVETNPPRRQKFAMPSGVFRRPFLVASKSSAPSRASSVH